jgi:hypothetical protein
VTKIILMLAAACLATGLNAQKAAPGVIGISLSPSGNKVAYISFDGRSTEAVYVAELAESGGTPKPILVHPDEASELQYCGWANEDRLICRLRFTRDGDGNPQDFLRLFAMNGQGQEFAALTNADIPNGPGPRPADGTVIAFGPGGKQDKILMMRNWVPKFVTSTRVSQDDIGLGVEEVDLADGKRRTVEQPDPTAAVYAADETGRVRFIVRQSFGPGGPSARTYFYRDAEADRWHEMTAAGADGFRPVAVDGAKNIAYGFVDREGHKAAASLTLESEGKLEILLHRPDADISRFVTLAGRVVGALDGGKAVYFEEDLRGLASGLQQALPGQPAVTVAGSSADGNRLLIIAGDASGSGMTYLFERSTRQLSEVMPVRLPELVNGI